MKVVLSACALAAVAVAVLAAPAPAATPSTPQEVPELQILEKLPELFRDKRSHFGGGVPYYSGSGCGSAPIAAIAPAYHAPAHAYAHSYSTHSYAPQGYGYIPHYREMEEPEMTFQDMEPMMSDQMPMSRFAYAPAPAHYGGSANLGGVVTPVAATTGPAFGVFPKANPGGCAVPLLLSCSPSIVPGRIVNAHPSPTLASQGHETYYRADEIGPEEMESQHHQHHHHQHQEQQPLAEPAQDHTNTHQ